MHRYFFLIFLLILGEERLTYAVEEINFSKIDKEIQILYKINNFKPFWREEQKVKDFLNLIETSHLKGLNPEDYKLDSTIDEIKLTKIAFKYCKDLYFGRLNPKDVFDTWNIPKKQNFPYEELVEILNSKDVYKIDSVCEPKFEQYKKLKNFLKKYYQIKGENLPKIKRNLFFDKKNEEVKNLKRILYIYGDYTNQENLETDIFDEEVLQAVKSFQERNQLEPDGVVGPKTRHELNKPVQERIQIMVVNMEKFRWLPDNLYSERIEVNIPSFSLKYFQNNKEILQMKVIVGKNYIEDFRPTPIYYGKITEITINPFWYVPYKIAVKDLLPKIKKNPNYLKENNFKVVYDGKEVDYKKINWFLYNDDYFPFKLIQKPGEKNSLGRIKITFLNPFGVFLHDTPYKELFLKVKRAFSSGCIRLEDALLLSTYLLNRGENDILEMINTGKTKKINLDRDVFVYILYFTTEIKNDKIFFYEDIYRFDKKILKKLNENDRQKEIFWIH